VRAPSAPSPFSFSAALGALRQDSLRVWPSSSRNLNQLGQEDEEDREDEEELEEEDDNGNTGRTIASLLSFAITRWSGPTPFWWTPGLSYAPFSE